MARWIIPAAITAFALFFLAACSNGENPIYPNAQDNQLELSIQDTQPHPQLWGYYDVYFNPDTESADVVVNRNVAYATNVVSFLNNTAGLSVKINAFTPTVTHTDVDVDVSVTHPLSGNTGFNGYDVMVVFPGGGAASLPYDTTVIPADTSGPFPIGNPGNGFGAPDGYTRWFNAQEFTIEGLFGYTPGTLASKNYTPAATLNPYKYYSDGLGATSDLWSYLVSASDNGVFSSGSKNTRNFFIRFPEATGLKISYAVVARWEGLSPDKHPANAGEAVGFFNEITKDIVLNGPGDFTGSLIFNLSVFDWDAELVSGVMEEYVIKIDSSVLTSTYVADTSDMTPINSGSHWHTYHFEIPAETVESISGNYMWAIVEYPGLNYSNPFSIPNAAQDKPLASYNRYDVPVDQGVPAEDIDVEIGNFYYAAKDIVVKPGQLVRWTNAAGFHSVTVDALCPVPGGPDSEGDYPSGMLGGDIFEWTCPDVDPGTKWFYHCLFHAAPGNGFDYGVGAMVASILVE
jgi:plastocyanin